MDATNPPGAKQARTGRYWVSLALLAGVILLYVVLINGRGPASQGTTGPAIGRHLAYLKLEGLTGETQSVSLADLQGRVTLINYWGSWCPPCIRELPQIGAIQRTFADRDEFWLLAVSCGQGSDADLAELREATETFLKARGMFLPTYADQNAASRQAMSLLLSAPLGYPTTLVLDRSGTIRGFWQGYNRGAEAEMTRLIEELLAESTKAKSTTAHADRT